jgi:hypothetical protein
LAKEVASYSMSQTLKKNSKILSPIKETLKLDGRLSYGESSRAWNIIRFKEQLLREFPQLKKRKEKFGYKLLMHRNYADLLKEVQKLKSEKEVIPLLLFLCKRKD